jgi:hypothetical protein
VLPGDGTPIRAKLTRLADFFLCIGVPALMNLITTFPLERYEISAAFHQM